MKLTSVQDKAVDARLALVIGAATFDRVFASVRFDEVDGDVLFVYSNADINAAPSRPRGVAFL